MRKGLRDILPNKCGPDSLRFKLLSRSLLILAVLLVLIGIMQYAFMQNVVYSNRAASLQSQVMSISPETWAKVNPDARETTDNGNSGPPLIFVPGASLAFYDLEGNYYILANGPVELEPPHLTTEHLPAMEQRRHIDYTIFADGTEEQLVVFQPVVSQPGGLMGWVQISTPTAPMDELLFRQSLIFFLLALVALGAGLLAYRPVIRKTLVPLSNMVDTAAQINAGNLDQRFPTQQGQQEIDRLAESCNGMLARLETSFAAEKEAQSQMRQFIADASHELRTPLTSIHGFLEVLLRGAASQPEQLDKALRSMHSESQRLNKLVNDLLLLSKLDRTASPDMESESLDEVIQSMEPQLRILAGNRTLKFDIEAGIICRFNSDQIKQVVLNLFQNAVQHTNPEQGVIEVALHKINDGGQLNVADNGPGINPTHLPHVFDRFYRSDSARARRDGGAGLGLSISKAIIEAHNGSITVISNAEQGTTFQVWLPLDSPPGNNDAD